VASLAPVGPLELLALPNSDKDLTIPSGGTYSMVSTSSADRKSVSDHQETTDDSPNLGSVHQHADLEGPMNGRVPAPEHIGAAKEADDQTNGGIPEHANGAVYANGSANGKVTIQTNGRACSKESPEFPKEMKRRKSVRFSPTVEQTTFIQTEPLSPNLAATVGKADESPLVIEDQEHLQLTMEETLFLTYGLGVLTVYDPKTKEPFSVEKLFSLFRQSSYFPPSEVQQLTSDDPFMISYVVYHHFRSLGWVVRGGTKFSVDYLLYNRGPVFSHAEFAVMILPSYSDPYWSADADIREYVSRKEKRSWSWLHCINRVNSQVKKTLILVYVDIPPPLPAHVEHDLGMDGVLKRYKVREIVLKRWLSNRSRD